MAYQALYRKYRPKTFSDVVGQEHITNTLKHEVATGKVVHAYLFTGTRGTGKTSCAKILAKAVNCLNLNDGDPCLKCELCRISDSGENTDIVEIDAASNNSVESIRELREQVSFAPACSKYRVYIIDEVHMLTISAFNALLKTLEEPPAHVIFILATTEVHKLPATILSRCQRFDFRRIDEDKICERIQYIANQEGLTVTEEAASLIASAADGGMRDALSILDLCASNNKSIDENVVASVCSMAGNEYLIKLADYINSLDCENALLLLDELHNSSIDMLRLLNELIGHFRNLMIIKTVKNGKLPIVCSGDQLNKLKTQSEKFNIKDIMFILDVLQSSTPLMQSGNRRCEMEMIIIKLCNPKVCNDIGSLVKRIELIENTLSSLDNIKIDKSVVTEQNKIIKDVKNYIEEVPLPDAPPETESGETTELKESNSTVDKRVENWSDIIKTLRKSCPLIAGVLEGSNAYIRGAYLLIDTDNEQFRSLINSGNSMYRESIRKAAFSALGQNYKLGPYSKASVQNDEDPLAQFAERLKNIKK